MPMDEVPTEELASQQQTLAVAEGPLQDMTVTCKQCEVTFVFTKGGQQFFQRKKTTKPARCPECRKWIREKRAETASKNQFQDSPSGPKFKTTTVAWPCVMDGGQKPQTLMREVGCKHEERSNAN